MTTDIPIAETFLYTRLKFGVYTTILDALEHNVTPHYMLANQDYIVAVAQFRAELERVRIAFEEAYLEAPPNDPTAKYPDETAK